MWKSKLTGFAKEIIELRYECNLKRMPLEGRRLRVSQKWLDDASKDESLAQDNMVDGGRVMGFDVVLDPELKDGLVVEMAPKDERPMAEY